MYRVPKDLQYFQLDNLNINSSVRIKLPSRIIEYKVNKNYGYYLENCTKRTENNAIFKALEIDSPINFVMNIVGYMCDELFPEMKTQEDLLKVIVALDKECVKKFGDKNKQNEFKDGDYISLKIDDRLFYIMIFKQCNNNNNNIYRYANYSCTTGNLYLEDGYIHNANYTIEHSTKDESKILDDELLKKGLVWDAVCKKLVPVNTIQTVSSETKPIFKVGDVVRIKPRTKEANCYRPMYTDNMTKYAGKITTVTRISNIGSLILDIDPSYFWAPEILEKVENGEIVSTADLTINTVQSVVKPLTLTELKQTESEKINLFPTKKHYKFNFSIN